MPYTIQIIGLADGSKEFGPPPLYLKSFNANSYHGLGAAGLTPNLDEALKFDTMANALNFWKTQSTLKPLRPDGKPNRPLTAYTVLIEPMEKRDGC